MNNKWKPNQIISNERYCQIAHSCRKKYIYKFSSWHLSNLFGQWNEETWKAKYCPPPISTKHSFQICGGSLIDSLRICACCAQLASVSYVFISKPFHLNFLSVRQYICLILPFLSKMIVQVHFNGDFTRKNILLTLGLNPTTIWFLSVCLSIIFLTGISISSIDCPKGNPVPGGLQSCHLNNSYDHHQHHLEPVHQIKVGVQLLLLQPSATRTISISLSKMIFHNTPTSSTLRFLCSIFFGLTLGSFIFLKTGTLPHCTTDDWTNIASLLWNRWKIKTGWISYT